MNGGVIGRRNVPGVDGTSGVWSLQELADMRRKMYSIISRELNPTALYMMEESAGTEMTDSSLSGNHGTYFNGLLPSTPGLITEGENSIHPISNLYATAPGVVAPALSGFSIVLWVKWSHGNNRVICERNNTVGHSIQTYSGGAIGVTSAGNQYLKTSAAYNDNLNHCVVFSFGATAAQSYLYIDGVDVTTRPNGDQSPSYGGATVWHIGSRAGSFPFDGLLDAVMFVGHQLTLVDAENLNTAGRFGPIWPV